ncbi:MAG: PilN domain-containing protein [Pseudomonadota bacterium]
MTRLNLLPWRDLRRKEQDRQLLSIAVGVWILMGLVIFYAHLHVSGLIEGQQKRNEFLVKETKKLDEEIKEIKELQAARAALLARMRVIQQLQMDRTQVVHLFDDLARKLPEGVYLTSFKQAGQTITLIGNAQSNARVSAFMRNLDASDWYTKPDLDVINVKTKGGDRVSEFTLRVDQKVKLEKDGAVP